MDFGLKGRTAIVCGSSQGIGEAIARALAGEGVKLFLVARNEQKLDLLIKDLPGDGHTPIAADLAVPEATERVCKVISSQEIDIVINNTGGPAPGPLTEARIEDFEQAIRMHLHASHRIMQAVLPGMKTRGFGRFINVISTSVKMPIPGLGVSNTVRGAMASWSKTLATEVAPFGITVNNILPGAVETDRLEAIFKRQADHSASTIEEARQRMIEAIPARRIGKPEELGNLAAFLASEKAAYINGVNIPVDGGRTGSLP